MRKNRSWLCANLRAIAPAFADLFCTNEAELGPFQPLSDPLDRIYVAHILQHLLGIEFTNSEVDQMTSARAIAALLHKRNWTPAATADPMTPATFGPIACISK